MQRDESYLLIQALYQDTELLLPQLLQQCTALELEILYTGKREALGWVSLNLQVSGRWHQLAKLESQLEHQAEALQEGHLFWQRQDQGEGRSAYLPYVMQAQTLVQNTLIEVLVQFFTQKQIKLQELTIERCLQTRTLIPMQQVCMRVYLPLDVNLPELRENFLILCEQYNFDAIFELDRG